MYVRNVVSVILREFVFCTVANLKNVSKENMKSKCTLLTEFNIKILPTHISSQNATTQLYHDTMIIKFLDVTTLIL